nr:unnamed protein product [Callosobruchus analis]
MYLKRTDLYRRILTELYECADCIYKTVVKNSFLKHRSGHSKPALRFKDVRCINCNVTFKSKRTLDYHVVKTHPNVMNTVTRKIYACTECAYKTPGIHRFLKHISTHSESGSNYNPSYNSLIFFFSMEKGIIPKVRDQVINQAVGSKSFICYICNYTAFSKRHLIDHMIVHDNEKYGPGHSKRDGWNANISNKTVKPVACSHCDASFRDKRALDDHVLKKHPDFISSIISKLHECTKCAFKTIRKCSLNRHLLEHREVSSNAKLKLCIHCNATFTSKLLLDDHVVRKHPDFISSVTSKLHECTKCTFKTAQKSCFCRHLLKHPELCSDPNLCICIHCNATFSGKWLLDDHVVKKHPDFISSITSKLHECTKCTFKTTRKSCFSNHLLKHPGLVSDFKLRVCNHCNATFMRKLLLDDHVARKHPNFISSVTSKLHECTKCTFKTVKKSCFSRHLLKHPGLGSDPKKHPDFISSVTRKLYECTKCTFKTVKKSYFSRHLLKHPELASDFKLKVCSHCNATLTSKLSLDDHVVRKHPDFISSVTSKLHECTKCTFKTAKKSYFSRHLLKHPELASDFKLNICIHCNATFKSKKSLEDHLVKKHPDFIKTITTKITNVQNALTKLPQKLI